MRRLAPLVSALLLGAVLAAPAASADVVIKASDGPLFVIYAKYGPFWRARERGVVGIRACSPELAAKLPRPAKVPVGNDLGSKPANDAFWDKYDRWMEKAEPGCDAKPAQFYTAATFRALVQEAGADGMDDVTNDIRAFNDVSPDFKGRDDPLTVLTGVVSDRYQLMDLDLEKLPRLHAVFLAIATGALASLQDDPATGQKDPQNLPLPAELAQDPMPQPTGRTGTAEHATARLTWGGPTLDVALDQAKGLRVVKLSDGLALAPQEGGLMPIGRNQEAVAQQLAAVGLAIDEYALTAKDYVLKNRDAWTLRDFRSVYASLGDESKVFVLANEIYVLARPGGELRQVTTSERYPLEETLVKRVGTAHVFRGARAEAELIRAQEKP